MAKITGHLEFLTHNGGLFTPAKGTFVSLTSLLNGIDDFIDALEDEELSDAVEVMTQFRGMITDSWAHAR